MGLDCNDDDPLVNPGAIEICGDGIDNDCFDGDLPCEIREVPALSGRGLLLLGLLLMGSGLAVFRMRS